MGIDITGAGVSMDEVAKDEDSSYRPDGEAEAAAKHGQNHTHVPGYPNLRMGGTNRGGTGRPPSEIRQVCREYGYKQIANLGKLVDKLESGDIEMSVTEQTRLSEALNKYGVGSTIAYTLDSEETLKLTIEVVERLYPGVISATKVIDSVMEQLK